MRAVRAASPLLILTLALPLAAGAESKPSDGARRWSPSLAITTGLLAQDAKASSFAGPVIGPALEPISQPIRPATDGAGTLLAAEVGASLELMTPRLADGFAQPRLFAHAGLAAAFGSAKNLAHEGALEPLAPPPVNPHDPFSEDVVVGQGTQTRAQTQPLLVSAGGGVAFDVDWWGLRLRIKPSIEYYREEIRLEGSTNRAIFVRATNGNILLAEFDDSVRKISFASAVTQAYHGVGPGLEIETDVERIGPFIWSMFVNGKATAFIGDLELATNVVNEFGEVADWSFEKARWAYRAHLGLRFRWLPE